MTIGRKAAIGLISALLIYGTGTVIFTSKDLGRTFDERLYNDAGLIYMDQHRFDENHDHPPLSKWVAAIYPHYSGDHRVEAFRYAHSFIYAAGGGVIAFQLLAWGYSLAAVLFGFLYFLCPNTKAMASLNVLDGDIAILMGVLALYTWRGFSSRVAGRMGFLQGIAATTKINGLFYTPFLFLRLRQLKSGRANLWAFAGFLFAFLIAYHFRVLEFGWYGASLGFQWKHNHAGQLVHVLGRSSSTGFWFTYIVLFLLKTPIPALLLMASALVLFLRSPRAHKNTAIYWIFPAVLMLLLLSAGNVQMGIRYALPALIYLYMATAVILAEELRVHSKTWKQIAVGATCLSLLVCDWNHFERDTYIAYFNFLSPDPIRNFCDSNIDWQQGIPLHLSKTLPPHESIETLSAFRTFSRSLSGEGSDHFNVEAGASNLCGAMSSRPYVPSTVGPLLLGFSAAWQGAGYEILDLTKPQLFALWKVHDQVGHPSFKSVMDLIGSYAEKCGAARKLVVTESVGGVVQIPPGDATIASDILVSTISAQQPRWSEGRENHLFIQDGDADEHAWRAWIPREDVSHTRITDAAGNSLPRPRFVTAAISCR